MKHCRLVENDWTILPGFRSLHTPVRDEGAGLVRRDRGGSASPPTRWTSLARKNNSRREERGVGRVAGAAAKFARTGRRIAEKEELARSIPSSALYWKGLQSILGRNSTFGNVPGEIAENRKRNVREQTARRVRECVWRRDTPEQLVTWLNGFFYNCYNCLRTRSWTRRIRSVVRRAITRMRRWRTRLQQGSELLVTGQWHFINQFY